MKTTEDFMKWARMEIGRKFVDEAGETEMNMKCDILNALEPYLEEENFVRDAGNALRAIDRLVVQEYPLTPITDNESDWLYDEEMGAERHKRLPWRLYRSQGIALNMARFKVCNVSDPDNPVYRTATAEEVIEFHKIYPIGFPYYPNGIGILYILTTRRYVAFMKYKDECDGKYYDIRRYFDTSGSYWKEIPFSVCADEFTEMWANVMSPNSDS